MDEQRHGCSRADRPIHRYPHPLGPDGCDDDAQDYIIAVENSKPYDSAVFELPPIVIEHGRRFYGRLLDRWKTCRELDQWPGRYPGVTTLYLPEWAEEKEGF